MIIDESVEAPGPATTIVGPDSPAHEPSAGTKLHVPVVLLWCVGAAVFFRSSVTSGFDKIMGNVGDARLIAVIHEHWLEVLRGDASWRSPAFFYPQQNTLGYSDTFVLNEVFYLPLRIAGFDMYAAMQWTFVLLSLTGFVGFYYFVRRVFDTPTWTAGLLATTFCFANNLYLKAGHPQLFSIYWVPVVALLAHQSLTATSRRSRAGWGLAAGLLSGLVLYSTFYIGWFAVLTIALIGVGLAVLRIHAVGFLAVWAWVRRATASFGGFVAGFAIVMIPFALTYIPVLKSKGTRTYDEAMFYAPRPGDIINVGANNLWWSAPMKSLFSGSPERLLNGEISLALTPLLYATVVVAACMGFVVTWKSKRRDVQSDAAIVLFAAVVALVLLPVKFGIGSLWFIPFTFVPGAQAIRAIGRIQIMNTLIAGVSIASSLHIVRRSGWKWAQQRWVAVAGTALLLVVSVEQINTERTSLLDRSDEMQFIVTTPDPPGSCEVFFIIDGASPPVPFFQSNIDAMIISQRKQLPTMNGYSGQLPVGWDLDPSSVDYIARIASWMSSRSLPVAGVCSYNRTTRVWDETPFA